MGGTSEWHGLYFYSLLWTRILYWLVTCHMSHVTGHQHTAPINACDNLTVPSPKPNAKFFAVHQHHGRPVTQCSPEQAPS
jgi:hypothetical protein